MKPPTLSVRRDFPAPFVTSHDNIFVKCSAQLSGCSTATILQGLYWAPPVAACDLHAQLCKSSLQTTSTAWQEPCMEFLLGGNPVEFVLGMGLCSVSWLLMDWDQSLDGLGSRDPTGGRNCCIFQCSAKHSPRPLCSRKEQNLFSNENLSPAEGNANTENGAWSAPEMRENLAERFSVDCFDDNRGFL